MQGGVEMEVLDLFLSGVHTKHLGRIISGLGFGLVGVDTLKPLSHQISVPVYKWYTTSVAWCETGMPAYVSDLPNPPNEVVYVCRYTCSVKQ